MKITPKLLSIPPYISTGWNNIASLHVRNQTALAQLIITLNDGTQIEIPNLAQEEIDSIFQAHAEFSSLEAQTPKSPLDNSFSFSLPIQPDGTMLDSLSGQMQHNPEQSTLPPLPPHVLEKISSLIKAFGLEDPSILDKPEPNCNCVYCQLTRSLQGEPEEEIKEEDLQFRDWEVKQKEERLYHVTNPLDQNEYYDVFLGNPIGCTCGSKNCEHIRAVLNT